MEFSPLFLLKKKLWFLCPTCALGVCCTGIKSSAAPGPGVQDSGLVPLQGIRGGSVLFHVTKNRGADPEEVSWGFGPELNYSVMLQVHRGADTPTWVSLQDKYQHRVHVPNILSLRIDNLIPEDSGQYRARASFTRGIELNQVFLLTVYGKWHLLIMASLLLLSEECQVGPIFQDPFQTPAFRLFSPLN